MSIPFTSYSARLCAQWQSDRELLRSFCYAVSFLHSPKAHWIYPCVRWACYSDLNWAWLVSFYHECRVEINYRGLHASERIAAARVLAGELYSRCRMQRLLIMACELPELKWAQVPREVRLRAVSTVDAYRAYAIEQESWKLTSLCPELYVWTRREQPSWLVNGNSFNDRVADALAKALRGSK